MQNYAYELKYKARQAPHSKSKGASGSSHGAEQVFPGAQLHLSCQKGHRARQDKAGGARKLTNDAHEPLNTWFPVLQHPVLHSARRTGNSRKKGETCRETCRAAIPADMSMLTKQAAIIRKPA